MPRTPVQRRFIKVDEAAVIFGIAPRTVRRYIALGRITGYRVGDKSLRVELAELEEKLLVPTRQVGGLS
jgi:excisionase family DNA binding protein